MKTMALAAMVVALAAAVFALVTTTRERNASGHLRDESAVASPVGALGSSPGALEDVRSPQPRRVAPKPSSEPPSYDLPEAAPVATTATPPRADEQVAALRQLVAQSRQENEQLGRIGDRLASLRRQAADEELRREEKAEQAAAQHDATLQALGTLRQAEAMLATGDADGVDDELIRAEAALSGRRQFDVDAAREALGRSDLYAARQYLAAALAERRSLR